MKQGTQGDGSLVITEAKKRGEITSLLLCISQNMLFFVKKFSSKIARKPSIYKAFSHFCVIITRASIRRTIPVAFIYTFLLKLQIVILLSVKRRKIYFERK